MTGWRIVCEVGGTNIRIARCEGPKQLVDISVQPTEYCPSLLEALLFYCGRFSDCEGLLGAAIAGAGPVEDGRVSLTNGQLTIDRDTVSKGINGRPVVVLNDLEATAYALPLLSADDIASVVAVHKPLTGPRLVVNVGTGFGAALLIQTAKGWHAVATEAGHMTFGFIDQTGAVNFSMSSSVSVEDRLSGLALCGRTDQLGTRHSAPKESPTPPAYGITFVDATSCRSPFSSSFGELLGAVCGNLVLAAGAWGGVYLCGSVASAWCKAAEFSAFTAAFQNKGRMSSRMRRVQVNEIISPHPALLGLTTIGLS
jgi:glucokinase